MANTSSTMIEHSYTCLAIYQDIYRFKASPNKDETQKSLWKYEQEMQVGDRSFCNGS